MKITDEVYAVGGGRNGFGISDKYDSNVFLVDGGEQLTLIDAGCGYDIEPILDNICSDGFDPGDIRRLLLTHAHADHSGGAAVLRERLDLEVALSHQEAKFLEEGDEAAVSLDRARDEGIYPADFRLTPCTVDRRLSHGDEVRCGRLTIRAIEIAGQQPSSICYLLTGGERTCLFSGDTVFLFGAISLLNCEGSSLAGYRRDIHRLANLGVEALMPGHGGFCLRGGQSHLDEAIEALKSVWPPRNYR